MGTNEGHFYGYCTDASLSERLYRLGRRRRRHGDQSRRGRQAWLSDGLGHDRQLGGGKRPVLQDNVVATEQEIVRDPLARQEARQPNVVVGPHVVERERVGREPLRPHLLRLLRLARTRLQRGDLEQVHLKDLGLVLELEINATARFNGGCLDARFLPQLCSRLIAQ